MQYKNILAVFSLIFCLSACTNNAADESSSPHYISIPDGVYVTDKLLYTSPYKDSFFGDNNGLLYEIKGNLLSVSNNRGDHLDDNTFSVSEPMAIPFTNEEWDEIFDICGGSGWQNGEINISDYSEKYCMKLNSDNDSDADEYLFVMDDELWYVSMIEIYKLKLA